MWVSEMRRQCTNGDGPFNFGSLRNLITFCAYFWVILVMIWASMRADDLLWVDSVGSSSARPR